MVYLSVDCKHLCVHVALSALSLALRQRAMLDLFWSCITPGHFIENNYKLQLRTFYTNMHAYIHTYKQTYVHTVTYHYIPCIPLHTIPTITYHYIPSHTIAYHSIPLHTIPYRYIPLHTITKHYIT